MLGGFFKLLCRQPHSWHPLYLCCWRGSRAKAAEILSFQPLLFKIVLKHALAMIQCNKTMWIAQKKKKKKKPHDYILNLMLSCYEYIYSYIIYFICICIYILYICTYIVLYLLHIQSVYIYICGILRIINAES